MTDEQLFHSAAVDIEKLSEVQIEAWRRCAETAAVANPFFEPECQLPAVEYHVDGGHDAQLVVAERDGDLLACLPVHSTVHRWGPLHRREANSRTAWTSVGLGSPLMSSRSTDLAAQDLLSAMQRWSRAGGPGIMVLDWLDDDDHGVGSTIRKTCADRRIPLYVRRTWERPVVRRSASGLSLDDTLSKKFRVNLNRHQRRLEEALGGPLQVTDRANDADAVDEFLRLEASGWKRTDGGAYAVRPEAERWFRSLCTNFAALGRLHLLSLEVAGRTVAMECYLRSGSSAFLMRIAHDAEFDVHGPGVLMHVAGVRYLDTMAIDLIDTCSDPGNALLVKLYPQRRQLATFVIATGGRVDRIAVRAMPSLAAGQRTLRRLSSAAKARIKSREKEPRHGVVVD